MTPEQFITQLKAMYVKADEIDNTYNYMWEDALGDLDELIGKFGALYANWQDTDHEAEARDAVAELRADQRSGR